jgi:hypothetical protein
VTLLYNLLKGKNIFFKNNSMAQPPHHLKPSMNPEKFSLSLKYLDHCLKVNYRELRIKINEN